MPAPLMTVLEGWLRKYDFSSCFFMLLGNCSGTKGNFPLTGFFFDGMPRTLLLLIR